MGIYSKYVNIKQICSALYFNAGVIISSVIFMFADPDTLELGKVFSTIALLGYVFNFSVLYSNYALEALYTIVVFNKRIDKIVLRAQEYAAKNAEHGENGAFDDQHKDFNRQQIRISEVSESGRATRHMVLKSGSAPSIRFDNVSAIWSSRTFAETGQAVLKDISFDFSNYERIALIGRVGCGKSTLLNTILKEAFIQKGSVLIQGTQVTASYAEQNPLIISGTVRSNILYGSAYDKSYYQQVVRACQLLADFEQFPQRDLTKTGEMGVSLSGGQRARISLARALYKRAAKIMLIDGTLSSLDSRVAANILNEIKRGSLFEDKIVFMVTYDLDQAQ